MLSPMWFIYMYRRLPLVAFIWCALGVLHSATLERLSLDEMILKSTDIVKARVGAATPATHGAFIYTHYQVQILERWKGTARSQMDVVIPGGVSRGLSQTYAGAPSLNSGQDYVMYLWTSRTGLTHIIGLSQGLFQLKPDGKGGLVTMRPGCTETMLDPATKQVVKDDAVVMGLEDMRDRVARKLSGAF